MDIYSVAQKLSASLTEFRPTGVWHRCRFARGNLSRSNVSSGNARHTRRPHQGFANGLTCPSTACAPAAAVDSGSGWKVSRSPRMGTGSVTRNVLVNERSGPQACWFDGSYLETAFEKLTGFQPNS